MLVSTTHAKDPDGFSFEHHHKSFHSVSLSFHVRSFKRELLAKSTHTAEKRPPQFFPSSLFADRVRKSALCWLSAPLIASKGAGV